MTRKCLLCSKTQKEVTFHAFPKSAVLREKWIEFCRSENNEEARLNCTNYLCSSHFSGKDYLNMFRGVQNKLKKHAIPSIGKRNHQEIEGVTTDRNPKHLRMDSMGEFTAGMQSPDLKLTKIESDTPLGTPSPQIHTLAHSHATLLSTSTSSNIQYENIDENSSADLGSKSPFFKEARYVGDITSLHLATPQRAKRAKATIAKQKTEIANLQQVIRRLQKRIATIQDLVEDLRNRNLMTNKAANKLMAIDRSWS